MRLGEVIDAPTLFKGAPQLRDMQVIPRPDWAPNQRGGISPDGSEIHINPNLPPEEMLKVIEHETSHGAAKRHGLPGGDAYSKIMAETKQDMRAIDEQLDMYGVEQARVHALEGPFADKPQAELDDYLNQIYDKKQELITERAKAQRTGGTPKQAFNTYESRAGEATARNDAARLGLTGDERRMMPPRTTVGLDQRPGENPALMQDLFGMKPKPPGRFIRGVPFERQTLSRGDDIAGDSMLMSESMDELTDLYNRYNDTFDLQIEDVVDEVEFLVGDGRAPARLESAINKFRQEQRDDFTLGGRNDMGQAEDEFLSALKVELSVPGGTPGGAKGLLSDELPPATKPGTRTTVQRPERKVFPGVYRDPRAIVEESAGKVAPKSPNMPRLFGVTREDLDEMTKTLPQRVPQTSVPIHAGTGRGAPHTAQVMGRANTQRLQDIIGLGAQDPRFAGSYGWYNMEPMQQQMLALFGPEEGARRMAQLRQLGSGVSPQSAVPSEIKRASLANYAIEQGNPSLFYDKAQLPPGYGHLSHTGSHSQSARRIQETGQLFPPGYPLQRSPKVRHYDAAKRGQVGNPTADAHFARGVGLPDVRPMMTARNLATGQRSKVPNAGSLSETEYYPIREWYRDKVAAPVGLPGSPAQAIQWNVMGTSTGVDSPLSAPYLELLSDAITRRAHKLGIKPETLRDRYLAGKEHL